MLFGVFLIKTLLGDNLRVAKLPLQFSVTYFNFAKFIE
jgi:hypothetical protein